MNGTWRTTQGEGEGEKEGEGEREVEGERVPAVATSKAPAVWVWVSSTTLSQFVSCTLLHTYCNIHVTYTHTFSFAPGDRG